MALCLLPLKSIDMAEDIKMSEFSSVSNAEYIYAETADGSQVKIKNNQLVYVIGTLIDNGNALDLNAIDKSGLYNIGDKCENIPPNSGQTQGCILFHLHWDINCAKQLYFTYITGTIYYRHKTGSWSDWKQISFI